MSTINLEVKSMTVKQRRNFEKSMNRASALQRIAQEAYNTAITLDDIDNADRLSDQAWDTMIELIMPFVVEPADPTEARRVLREDGDFNAILEAMVSIGSADPNVSPPSSDGGAA